MIALSPLPHRVVIAVEKKSEMLVKDLVAMNMFFEDHFLKKPGRMGNVPPRWRDVDSGLRNVVLDLKRFTQLFGEGTNLVVKRAQVFCNAGLSTCLHLYN